MIANFSVQLLVNDIPLISLFLCTIKSLYRRIWESLNWSLHHIDQTFSVKWAEGQFANLDRFCIERWWDLWQDIGRQILKHVLGWLPSTWCLRLERVIGRYILHLSTAAKNRLDGNTLVHNNRITNSTSIDATFLSNWNETEACDTNIMIPTYANPKLW